MALWTPAAITTTLWLDAADTSTISNPSAITEWRDKSGNGNHAGQSVSGSRPAVVAAALNGLDVVSLDGVDDYFNLLSAVPITTDMAIAVVFGRATAGILSIGLGGTVFGPPYSEIWYTDNVTYTALGAGTSTHDSGSSATGHFVDVASRNSATVTVRRSGTTVGTPKTAPSVANSLPYVGRRYNNYHKGVLAEIVVFAPAYIEQIEGYLHWKWGLQSALPAGHPYKSAAPTLSANFRAILDQPYDLLPSLVRAILDQPYALMARLAALLDQVYGLRMLVVFNQPYGDAAQLRTRLDQRYGDAAQLRRKFEQLYGDSPKYRAALEQLYNLHAGLRAGLDQNYSIAEGAVRAILDQLTDLQDRDLVRMTLDMLYVLAAGEALVQRFDIAVSCAGTLHNSMANINIEQDSSLFYMAGELQLYCQAEYLQYRKFVTPVAITVDGWTCSLLAGIPRESRQPGQTTYVVPLYSPTILLDAPHSRLAAAELSGMAAALVATLAAPFTTSWQLVDWFIPPGRLAVSEGDAAINPIRRIVEAVGGVIQTDPAGILICRPEYPVSVDQWPTAAPDYHLTDQDDFFQVDHAPELRNGYNRVNVSDQQLAADGLTMETTTISPFESEIRIYQVPWDDDSIIRLHHSGDPARVAIVAGGSLIETITAERVEIVAGSGRTSKPFYRLLTVDYRETELGELTIAEDGTVTTAIAGNSLVYLDYWTRCCLFIVTDHTAEDVQFFPEEVAV